MTFIEQIAYGITLAILKALHDWREAKDIADREAGSASADAARAAWDESIRRVLRERRERHTRPPAAP